MRKNFFIILIFFAISVIYAKGFSDDIKYLDSASIYMQDIEKYKGVRYLFHSFIKYDNETYPPPFPYKKGRVRDGKFKASETALNEYIKKLSKYNNKSFTLAHVDYSTNNVKGIVMACENGDSLYFGISTIRQFINKEYFEEKLKLKGTKTIYQVPRSNYATIHEGKCPNHNCSEEELLFPKQYPYFVGFTDIKTKKTSFYLPYLSIWKIVDVAFDTTFVGSQTSFSNKANLFFGRIRLTIKNEKYGEYYYFEDNLLNIIRRNEVVEKDKNCEEPTQKENGRWEQKCTDFSKYWWNPVVFSDILVVPIRDCSFLLPPYESVCVDTTAFHIDDFRYYFANHGIASYSENEIRTIRKWASMGFVEAAWASAVLNNGNIDDGTFNKLIREGYPPAIAYVIFYFNLLFDYPRQNLFEGIKNAYKIYGKQLALDLLFDQFVKLSQLYPSTDGKKINEFYKKTKNFGYDSFLEKVYKDVGKVGFGSAGLNVMMLEQLFKESQIFPEMKFDEFYKKAVEIGYDSAVANSNINEYNNFKKNSMIIKEFKDSFSVKYIYSTSFEQNLIRIREFEKKQNFEKKNFNELVHFIIGIRVLPLYEQASKTSDLKDELTFCEAKLKLYTQAKSYGYDDFSMIGSISKEIARIKLELKLDSELKQDCTSEKIFNTIKHISQEINDDYVISKLFEKAIVEILDKQKKNSKDSLTEINLLEREIELYQQAIKFGYKNGLDSLEKRQTRLNYLKNVELYYKSGK